MVSIVLTLLKGAMFLVYHTLWSHKLGQINTSGKNKDAIQPTTSEEYDNNQ